MLIGLSGLANSGKDSVASALCAEKGFTQVSFADPMKRFCSEMFDWEPNILWGSSARRDRKVCGISPRLALQSLGDWGRSHNPEIWTEHTMRLVRKLVANTVCYSQQSGNHNWGSRLAVVDIVISDVRFKNELEAIKFEGGEIWRIVRPGAGLKGEAAKHISENDIQDGDCDRIIYNEGTYEDLVEQIRKIKL